MSTCEVWELASGGANGDEDGRRITDSADEIWTRLDHRKLPLFDRIGTKRATTRAREFSAAEKEASSSAAESSTDAEDFFDAESQLGSQEEPEDDADDEAYTRVWNQLQQQRAASGACMRDLDLVPRTWQSVFYISSMRNLQTESQHFFYCIKLQHENPIIVRLNMTMYTPKFTLGAGETKTLERPIFVWQKRRLMLPYGDLKRYRLTLELWKTSALRLNMLYASKTMTLEQVVKSKCTLQIELNLNVPQDKETLVSGNIGSSAAFAVHTVSAMFLMEEIFEFDLVFENWWFTGFNHLPPHLLHGSKILTLSMPLETGGSIKTARTGASPQAHWPQAGKFTFIGTARQLKSTVYVAKVYCIPANNVAAGFGAGGGGGAGGGARRTFSWSRRKRGLLGGGLVLLGTCVMSLVSVQEYPLVRGIVKRLTLGTGSNMQSGCIQGLVRCFTRSLGIPIYNDIKAKMRPCQPISGNAQLCHLDLEAQYLVVRINGCEDLPLAHGHVSGSAAGGGGGNVAIKVKWDGIVNVTPTIQGTKCPIFNCNMYFAIHLVDANELINPALIKHSLPIDLASKGPVVIEVWDHDDDTSLHYLGGAEVPLSRLYTHGVIRQRSLVHGLLSGGNHDEDEDSSNSLLAPSQDESLDMLSYLDIAAATRRFSTRLYVDVVPLAGSTIPTSARPRISLEMYMVPPMPQDLFIPPDNKRIIGSNAMLDISRRWTKDFDTWQLMYKDKNPTFAAIARRFPCVATNAQGVPNSLTNAGVETLALCQLVQPIATSVVLTQQGEILHWISNFAYDPEALQRHGNYLRIETWQFPTRTLLVKRGGLHDRALLLCSCLLGLGYDAYVCKGTLDGGYREHCWVMTRHASNGTVAFWETGNKRVYYIANRCFQKKRGAAEFDSIGESGLPFTSLRVQGGALDSLKGSDLPLTGPGVKGNALHTNAAVAMAPTVTAPTTCKVELLGNGAGDYLADERIDIWTTEPLYHVDGAHAVYQRSGNPNNKNLKPITTNAQTLLPYTSLEVVFNNVQLWGNLQSHKPIECLFDFNVESHWKPLLRVPLDPEPCNAQVVAPATLGECQVIEQDILNELVEMVEVTRNQAALKCTISTDHAIADYAESLLQMLEVRSRLDAQYDPGMPAHLVGWSKHCVSAKKPVQTSKIGNAGAANTAAGATGLATGEDLKGKRVKGRDGYGGSGYGYEDDNDTYVDENGNDDNNNNNGGGANNADEEASTADASSGFTSDDDEDSDGDLNVSLLQQLQLQRQQQQQQQQLQSQQRQLPLRMPPRQGCFGRFGFKRLAARLGFATFTARKRHTLTRMPFKTSPSDNVFVRGFKRCSQKLAGRRRSNLHQETDATMSVAPELARLLPLQPCTHLEIMDVPPEFQKHVAAQVAKWNWYYNWECRHHVWQRRLSVAPNSTLVGFPIHFSSCKPSEICKTILCTEKYKRIIANVDNVTYIFKVKVFPLVGGLVSTWLFIGCQVPWRL